MFYRIDRRLMADKNLECSDKCVLAVIQDRVGRNGVSWPGLRTIGADCGIATSTAQECIRRLVAAGYLEVLKVRGRRSNTYRVRSIVGRSELGNERSDSDTESARHPVNRRSDSGTEPHQLNQTQENQTKKHAVSARSSWDLADAVLTHDRLRTDSFRKAWEQWLVFRDELGKPLTNSTIRAQLRKLENLTHDQAIASIERSIEAGWSGLFPPRQTDPPDTGRVKAEPGKYDGIGSIAGEQ